MSAGLLPQGPSCLTLLVHALCMLQGQGHTRARGSEAAAAVAPLPVPSLESSGSPRWPEPRGSSVSCARPAGGAVSAARPRSRGATANGRPAPPRAGPPRARPATRPPARPAHLGAQQHQEGGHLGWLSALDQRAQRAARLLLAQVLPRQQLLNDLEKSALGSGKSLSRAGRAGGRACGVAF